MSLLMQALKRAEHTKQKQSVVTPNDALSLSPKEGIAPTVDTSQVTPGTPENVAAPISEMTLTPHADDTKSEEPHAVPPLVVTEPSSDNFVPDQPQPWVSHDLDKVNKEIVVNTANQSKEDADRTVIAKEPAPRHEAQKNGAEQKQEAIKIEEKLLAERKKAKSVFSSKLPQRNNRVLSMLVLGLLVLAVPTAIAYLYWQNMNAGIDHVLAGRQNNPILSPALPAVDSQAQKEPELAAAASTSISSQVNASTPLVSSSTASGASVSVTKPVPNTVPAEIATTEARNAVMESPGKPSETTSKTKNAASVAALDTSDIKIRTSSHGNQINPALSSAYQFFLAGDTASAKQQYQKVLQQEPNNRDALLGLAALALNQRQAEQAGAFYGKLLELDPGDPEAIAGLTSLQQGEPVQSESRLKKALNQHPQAGALLFALGNLYAQQSRWTDAQQTYFRAYASAPNNADYAFNLAVSLDKLNQGRLAKEYYQRALLIGQNGAANFNRSAVQKRISELDIAAN